MTHFSTENMSYCCKSKCMFWALIIWGTSFVISGFATIFLVSPLIESMIKNSLPLQNSSDSRTFEKWVRIPIPIYDKFYFFNITNVDDILNHGAKPDLKEVGPFVFKEEREKVNLTWSQDGDLVAYNQIRRWYFLEDESHGLSLDAEVYHINAPLIAASDYISRIETDEKEFYYFAVNSMQQLSKSILFPKHTIRQLMFDGYSDKLITEAAKLPGLNIPFDRFGWFFERNNTSSDKRYQIFTGKRDLRLLGRLNAWDQKDHLEYFRGDCNSLSGTSPELQPPFPSSTPERIDIFVGDICRPLKLSFKNSTEFKQVSVHRYELDQSTFNYDLEENKCFCPSRGCYKNGVADTSKCAFDSPSAASLPHFLHADPSYLTHVKGLSPNSTRHKFLMDIHPMLGVATRLEVGVQINLIIRREPGINFLQNMTTDELWLPILWFSASGEISDEMSKELLLLDRLPFYLMISTIASIVIGLLIISVTICFFCERRLALNRQPEASNGKMFYLKSDLNNKTETTCLNGSGMSR